MEESIKLSAAGRSVMVGDFYDYSSDQVITLDKSIDSCVLTSPAQVLCDVFGRKAKSTVQLLVQPSNAAKCTALNVNSHLEASLLANTLSEYVWHRNYLLGGGKGHNTSKQGLTAKISIHLQVSERNETFFGDKKEFFAAVLSNFPDQMKSATHFVTGVTYGFDAVFVLEMFCQGWKEKEFLENQLFLEAKRLFANFGNAVSPIFSQDQQLVRSSSLLQKAKLSFYTNLRSREMMGDTKNLYNCLKSLKRLIHRRNQGHHFVPVEITLCSLASIGVDVEIVHDLKPDMMTKLALIRNEIEQLNAKIDYIMEDAFLSSVPHLSKRLEEFWLCFEELYSSVMESIRLAVVKYRRSGNDNEINNTFSMIWNTYFSDEVLIEWLMTRHNEIFVLKNLLRDITVPWKPVTNELVPTEQPTEMFVFQTKKLEDPVISNLRDKFNIRSTVQYFTTYELFATSQQEQEELHLKLKSFCELKNGFVLLTTSENGEEESVISRPKRIKLSKLMTSTPIASSQGELADVPAFDVPESNSQIQEMIEP